MFIFDFIFLAVIFFLIVTLGSSYLYSVMTFISNHVLLTILIVVIFNAAKDMFFLTIGKLKKHKGLYTGFNQLRTIPVALYFISLCYFFSVNSLRLFDTLSNGIEKIIFTMVIIALTVLWNYAAATNDNPSADILVTLGHYLTTGLFIAYTSGDIIKLMFKFLI